MKADIELMKKAGINEAILGVFSWSVYEPREGEFHFEWLKDTMQFLFVFFVLLYFDTRIAIRTIITISAIKLMIAAMIIEITVNAGTINDAVSAGGL